MNFPYSIAFNMLAFLNPLQVHPTERVSGIDTLAANSKTVLVIEDKYSVLELNEITGEPNYKIEASWIISMEYIDTPSIIKKYGFENEDFIFVLRLGGDKWESIPKKMRSLFRKLQL